MRVHRLFCALPLLLLGLPSLSLSVTLDPGAPGNFFLWTSTGTVDALDSNGFDITFENEKYITITPYEEDARFLFGIDFNGSGLDATPIAGYLTDAAGSEIAGTAFTGTAISAGFGGGSLILNEVVIAYGARITFTGSPPATPFPVRMGSGVASNVFEDRPVIGQGEVQAVRIDAASACAAPDYFEFSVTGSGTDGEMVFRLGADTAPDQQLGPTERITTQIDALTGEINSEAEPIAESFGTPPFDRWQDGPLDDFDIDRVGQSGASWIFSGRVAHGEEPFMPGETLWGVTLSEGDVQVTLESLSIGTCDPALAEIVVPWATAPFIDGRISYREWRVAPQVQLDGGTVTFMHDLHRLYLLVNMRDDASDNPLRDGGPDQLTLHFDVDEDSDVSPDTDLRYQMLPGTGNFRFETYSDADGDSFNPPEDITFSALGEGFNCFLADGSATISPLSCFRHRVWEIAIDLLEIEASADKTARLGMRVQTDTDVIETLPADLGDFGDFLRLRLAFRTNLDEPSRGGFPDAALTLAELRVTQGVQNGDNGMPLVQGRAAYADVLIDTEVGEAESVASYLFMSRDGVDLPGSPFLDYIRYNFTWGSANRSDGQAQSAQLLPGYLLAGDTTVKTIARQPILGVRLETPEYLLSARPTETPVYWIVPVNTSDDTVPKLPGEEFLLRSQLEVEAAFPVAEVDFVRRPAIAANPDSAEDAIDLLNQYSHQAVLAWTLGLLITGEPPFALPDQIIGAFPADQELDGYIGMSDPRWWEGGAARVVWIKEVTADQGLLLPHELNHNLDTNTQGSFGRHVQGCGSRGLDSQWPYPNREIQEPALVTREVIGRRETLLPPPRRVPADMPDYMSYCRYLYGSRDTSWETYPYQWVSPYRWFRQLGEVFESNTPTASFARLSGNADSEGPVQDMLYITGRINSDGSGSLAPVLRQPGVQQAGQREGVYNLRLADCSNLTLNNISLAASDTNVEGGPRESTPFAMVLPDPGTLCEVQLLRGDDVLASRAVTPNSPEVGLLAPNGGEQWSGTQVIRWQASDLDGDALTATLLYSPDAGTSWLPIAGGIAGDEFALDTGSLPGSQEALIRVLVTDGLNTSEDQSDTPFQVVAKAPRVSIISPAAVSELRSGETVTLRGQAFDTAGQALPGDTFVWRLNAEPVALGNGATVNLPPGPGELTLEATAANGLTGLALLNLQVPGPDGDGDGIPDTGDSCPDSIPGSLVTVAECPTDVENRLLADGCALEELFNATLDLDGRDALIQLLKSLRKSGQLEKGEVKAIKKCIRE